MSLKARRIKVPDGLDLLSHKKLKSHWIWYWRTVENNLPKKLTIKIKDEEAE